MVVDSLITSVSKYFSTLSVDSIFGDSKVSLIIPRDYDDVGSTAFEDSERDNVEYVLELDATESISVNNSKRSLKHESESNSVFVDGVKVNPTRVTIVCHIDQTKLGLLEKFSKPNIYMHLLHTKPMGGSVQEIGYYADAKMYHILTFVTTDIGYKNTVKVQIELEEILLYKIGITSRTRVRQTNGVSGDGTSKTTNLKEVRYSPMWERWK